MQEYFEVWAYSRTLTQRMHVRYRGPHLTVALHTFREYMRNSAGWYKPVLYYGTHMHNNVLVRDGAYESWEHVAHFAQQRGVSIATKKEKR